MQCLSRSWLSLGLAISIGAAPYSGEPTGAAQVTQSVRDARQLARTEFGRTLALLVKTHDTKVAREGFRRSILLDPTFAPPYFNLGVVAEADEDWGDAVRWLGNFLKLEPNSIYAVRARSELTRIASIQASLRTPDGLKKNKYDEEIGRARVFVRTNMPAEAIAAAGKAADLDSSRWEAYAVTASALANAGKTADARRFIGMAIERAPGAKKAALEKALNGIGK
jgi:tetratricopeptide (TPR) repeat protein